MIRLRSCRSSSCFGVFPSRPREQSLGSKSTALFFAIFVTVLTALWRMAVYSSELYHMLDRSFSEKRSRLETSLTRTLRLKSTFLGGRRSSSCRLGESDRCCASLEPMTEVVLFTEDDDSLLVSIAGMINMDRAICFVLVDDWIMFKDDAILSQDVSSSYVTTMKRSVFFSPLFSFCPKLMGRRRNQDSSWRIGNTGIPWNSCFNPASYVKHMKPLLGVRSSEYIYRSTLPLWTSPSFNAILGIIDRPNLR